MYRFALPVPNSILFPKNPVLTAGHMRFIVLRNPAGMIFDDLCILRVPGKISPLMGIPVMVIELFRTIRIPGVAPPFRAYTMVSGI
jgi:hypothetical protein